MSYGQGGLVKRGKIWHAHYWDNGQEKWKTTGKTDRREALAFLRQITEQVSRSGRIDTIAQCVGLLFADYVRSERESLYDVKKRVEKHILPYWGKRRPQSITIEQIDSYVESRRLAKAADGTINKELAALRRALNLAHHRGLIPAPIHIAAKPLDNARQGFLEDSQFDRLKAELPEHLRCITIMAYCVGQRRGTLTAIDKADVDLAARKIHIRAKQFANKAKPRVLPIYGDMIPALEAQMQTPGRALFTYQGERLNTFYKAWAGACERAGLKGFLFHDLRRSAVRNMVRGGLREEVAMGITGHKTRHVFQRYNIIDEKDIRDAVQKLEAREEFFRETRAKPEQLPKEPIN